MEAVEKSKYGWFWECPSGQKCIYKHALPPGFVLQRDKKKDEKKDELSLEDLIETERNNLGPSQVLISLHQYFDIFNMKLIDCFNICRLESRLRLSWHGKSAKFKKRRNRR